MFLALAYAGLAAAIAAVAINTVTLIRGGH